MLCAASTQVAHKIEEDVADSKPVKRAGVITVSTVHTQPVLSWAVH